MEKLANSAGLDHRTSWKGTLQNLPRILLLSYVFHTNQDIFDDFTPFFSWLPVFDLAQSYNLSDCWLMNFFENEILFYIFVLDSNPPFILIFRIAISLKMNLIKNYLILERKPWFFFRLFLCKFEALPQQFSFFVYGL